jgi:3-hydroxybutyryl-CoA dehydrogenase
MKVAEVISAVRTDAAVVGKMSSMVRSTGHRAVVAADQPGFLVNHAGRGLYTEGLRLLEEQVASVSDIDDVLREAAGFRMGPFELLDLTGLDVSSKVMSSIYEQFSQEPRFRPSALVPPRVAAGLFGRKTGRGWYEYDGDAKRRPPDRVVPPLPVDLKVWVDPSAESADSLRALARRASCDVVDEPVDRALLIIQPWGADATRTVAVRGLDATRCVAVDPLPAFDVRRTVMLTAATSPVWRDAAHALLAHDGVAVTVINDSPGFIAQRTLATIVNIAANIAQTGVASVADLEDAVRLGLGYPQGPLGWGDRIGGDRIAWILNGLHACTEDPRYRVSPWIARRVALGLPLLTPEATR